MFNTHSKVKILILFSASLWLALATPSMASVDQYKNLPKVHELLTLIDMQIADKDTLAYGNGPLKSGKDGYGFLLKETFLPGLTCKVALNCSVTTSSNAIAERFHDSVLDCLIKDGWGQQSMYLVAPKNDLTKGKLCTFEKSISVDFVGEKQTKVLRSGPRP